MEKKTIVFCCTKEYNGLRVDAFLGKVSDVSRSQIEEKIKQNLILINGKVIEKKSCRVFESDSVTLLPEIKNKIFSLPSKRNIEVIFDHEDFMIINKPAGIISHLPANKTCDEYTIVDFASQYWCGPVKEEFIERKGIVHRLDKETSGIMIIAKHQYAMAYFLAQFKLRSIKKQYVAFTEKNEHVSLTGSISYNIMRDPCCPVKMTYAVGRGKEAETQYEIIKKTENFFFVKCFPLTGRTHQIRVHLRAINLPILGDKIYGKFSFLIDRCALHAEKIEFIYENKLYLFHAPLDTDMQSLLLYN